MCENENMKIMVANYAKNKRIVKKLLHDGKFIYEVFVKDILVHDGHNFWTAYNFYMWN